MVSCTLHVPGREGFGLSDFVALPLEAPIAGALALVEEEVGHSCAAAHVKDRLISVLLAYAGSATLIPAFQISQTVSPPGDTDTTRVVISHVRTCSAEFLLHLVSTPAFGVTRVVFRTDEEQLELFFTGVVEDTTQDDATRPRKRQKQRGYFTW